MDRFGPKVNIRHFASMLPALVVTICPYVLFGCLHCEISFIVSCPHSVSTLLLKGPRLNSNSCGITNASVFCSNKSPCLMSIRTE